MKSIQPRKLFAAIALTLGGGAQAGESLPAAMPANMEEMWKIIQQQQKEIESLKAKAAQAPAATANASTPGVAAKPNELERKTDVLAGEVEKLKTQLYIPESREYKSQYGLGPAASNVYGVSRGVSIGGYGEMMYTNYADPRGDSSTNKDTADLERAVIYLGYKFNDWIILNNEIEFEHASTGEGDEEKGEVSVEFSQLDFLLDPKYNIRAGLMLVPMGFVNEMHEPTTFHGNRRPDVERFIIPSTWREVGAGIFGELFSGLEYRFYAVNGLNSEGFSSAGIRESRQGGSNAKAEDFAFTGRVDYSPSLVPGLMVGGSTFLGNSGQKDARFNDRNVDVFTQLYEGHIQYKYKGWELRALGAWSKIDDTALINSQLESGPAGQETFGWYVEGAHDVMPYLLKDSSQYLAPFVRMERYNTMASVANGFSSAAGLDRWIYQAGISYKPITNIVIKADYRNVQDRKIVPDSTPTGDELNLGVGFIY